MAHYKGFFESADDEFINNKTESLHYETNTDTKRDILRFLHAIISVFIFLCLHLCIDSINASFAINIIYIMILAMLKHVGHHNLRMLVKISCIIILWIYLLSPIIMSLTQEVSSDTIYLYYFIFNLIYSIDITKTSILNEINRKPLKKIYTNSPLSIEETYNNFRTHNICTLGYNFNILSSALLCSRYKEELQVTFVLLCNLGMFIIFPFYREKYDAHKNIAFSIFYTVLGTVLTYLCDTRLFICYCVTVYGVMIIAFLFVDAVNFYISQRERKYI